MNMKQEFTAFGFSIEKITIIYGAFLILWGLIVSFVSGSTSITSYIPSMFGWPMLFLGALALKLPDYKKILMHIVVILGLLIFLGGLDIVRNLTSGTFMNNVWASASKTMLLITGALFTSLCVKSFIFVRNQRKNN